MDSDMIQITVDEDIASQAAAIYEEKWLSLHAAVYLFLKRSIEVKGLPFEMSSAEIDEAIAERGLWAVGSIEDTAERNMTLDEINAEIAAARAERHERERAAR